MHKNYERLNIAYNSLFFRDYNYIIYNINNNNNYVIIIIIKIIIIFIFVY